MENPAIFLRRLNPYCAHAMEGAASLCQIRAHTEILPEATEAGLHAPLRPILRDHLQPTLLTHMAAKQKLHTLTLGGNDDEWIGLKFDATDIREEA